MAFSLGEVLVPLYLDTPFHGDEALIMVNLFGERLVKQIRQVMDSIESEITAMFARSFNGLRIGYKKEYPREYEGGGNNGRGNVRVDKIAVDGRNALDSMSRNDMVNAMIARIERPEAHIDRELSRLLKELLQLEKNLRDVAKGCHATLARFNKIDFGKVPCPSLLIVRPVAAIMSGAQKRSLRAYLTDYVSFVLTTSASCPAVAPGIFSQQPMSGLQRSALSLKVKQ